MTREHACILCAPTQEYLNQSSDFIAKLSLTMLPDFQLIFGSATALWMTIKGLDVILQRINPHKVLTDELPWIFIAWALLFINANGLIQMIFNLSIQVLTGISIKIFEVTGAPIGSGGGLVGLVSALEAAIWSVVEVAQIIIGKFAFPSNMITPIILSILLVLPYMLLLIVYFSQIIVNVFRIVILSTFLPFIFMAVGFGFWREMGKTAFKTILASIMVMSASTIVVSFAIFVVNSLGIELNENLGEVNFSNEKIIFGVIIGWAMSALLAEGTSIANSIAGSSLTNTAAGVMTAGIAGSAMTAVKYGASPKIIEGAKNQLDKNDYAKAAKGISNLLRGGSKDKETK